MFTGLVEELGKVKAIQKRGAVARLDIFAEKVSEGTKIGDSIAVNGACLTVVESKRGILSFDVVKETWSLTTLKNLRSGQEVNLERALKVGDRLGGHFVSGHIDCIGVVRYKSVSRQILELRIALPPKFLKFVILKGSVAVDGISLTISSLASGTFSVCIIPHTAKMTTLAGRKTGDQVNIELDMLMKKR